NTTGQRNTAVGHATMVNSIAGSQKTAVGHSCLINCKGSDNTAMGSEAGISLKNSNNLNIFIGSGAGAAPPATIPFIDIRRSIYIGASSWLADTLFFDNQTALGYNSRGTASNQVRIGNTSVTSIAGFVEWSNLS